MDSLRYFFLSQSYEDAYAFYRETLSSRDIPRWDYLILTAAGEAQAEAYKRQLDMRRELGMLPARTHYAVIPDPDGKRVGSGGATLNVLKYIREREGCAGCFAGKRVLVIHSGGDSRRAPQYSVLGKLFSPVPRELPGGLASTLFDEFIIAMSAVPGRMKDGMLVLSGDVLLLFNPLQIDFNFPGAAALSIKESVVTGKEHGVFLTGANNAAARFLHKQSEARLRELGAVDSYGNVDLDTGAVLMDSGMLDSLFSLISDGAGGVDPARLAACVNERVRLSFYGDFLYPLAADSTLEDYYGEKPEGAPSEELASLRREVWEALRPYRLRVINLSPAAFLHFGTTRELMGLLNESIGEFKPLGWKRNVASSPRLGDFAASNSCVHPRARLGPGCYIEDSEIGAEAEIGAGAMVSGATIARGRVPDGAAVSVVRLADGRFAARVYGVGDNPKEAVLLGAPLAEYMRKTRASRDAIWPEGREATLWEAKLYPPRDSAEEALAASMAMLEAFDEGAERLSLRESFMLADAPEALKWRRRLAERVAVESFLFDVAARLAAAEIVASRKAWKLTPRQRAWISERAGEMAPGEAMRVYYCLSKLAQSDERASRDYGALAFKVLGNAICADAEGRFGYDPARRIARDEAVTRLPLRVNWGGGWSDTPPHCNERGGTVLNAAVTVRGGRPVEARVQRLSERKLIFESADSGAYREFTDLRDVLDCSNPYDSFALHKAALLACGVLPRDSRASLGELLERLGGGIRLSTAVKDIPRGSGLGTSSILAGACVMALGEFMGDDLPLNERFTRVMCVEQIMSTGGGWQDQVGGMVSGVKLICSEPGIRQRLSVEHIALPEETYAELDERFCLIYTGQRRLARNLLRDVMGRYIGGEAEALAALSEIQKLAVLMRYALSRGRIDEFARLLDEQWACSKRLDGGSTNTCIDYIFMVLDDLLAGRMICGAGGGGFLQAVLKPGVTKARLRARLAEVFQNTGVDVWDCAIAR